MKKILIMSGGSISEKFAKQVIEKENFDNIIAVDKGLEMANKLQLFPDHIVRRF